MPDGPICPGRSRYGESEGVMRRSYTPGCPPKFGAVLHRHGCGSSRPAKGSVTHWSLPSPSAPGSGSGPLGQCQGTVRSYGSSACSLAIQRPRPSGTSQATSSSSLKCETSRPTSSPIRYSGTDAVDPVAPRFPQAAERADVLAPAPDMSASDSLSEHQACRLDFTVHVPRR